MLGFVNQSELDEVWTLLDKSQLEAIARRGPEPVFATVSGAHLYGFASRDSDVDLRGAFLLPASGLLGLYPPSETVTVEDKLTIELDWVAHDIRKFARMMVSHDGYILEQLYSPLVVLHSAAFEELRELGKGCLTRQTVRHYQAFARSRRKRLAEAAPTVKHLLHAYRALLSGTHLMRAGEIITNIGVLNGIFGLPAVDELAARKRAGTEKMPLLPDELAIHERELDRLEADLEQAFIGSTLPNEPSSVAALNDFVVRLRLSRAKQ